MSADLGADLRILDLGDHGPGTELVAHLPAVLDSLESVRAGAMPRQRSRELDGAWLLRLFDAQAASRWLDVGAHRLRALGYRPHRRPGTGHEQNAALGLVLRGSDPALVHHRSTAFQLARRARDEVTDVLNSGISTGLREVALSLVGGREEPTSGVGLSGAGLTSAVLRPLDPASYPGPLGAGVAGDDAIIPTSGVPGAQLPRAVGLAWVLGRQRVIPGRLRTPLRWSDDAVVLASVGDGGISTATAAASVNSICWSIRRGVNLPLLLVCEDNGPDAGPDGWVAELLAERSGLVYRYSDGRDPLQLAELVRSLSDTIRQNSEPAVLHLRCHRFPFGHGDGHGDGHGPGHRAGDGLGREPDLGRDPVVGTIGALVTTGALGVDQVRSRWAAIRDEVSSCLEEAVFRLRPTRVEDLSRLVAPHRPETVARQTELVAVPAERHRVHGPVLPEDEGPLTLAQALNRTLLEAAAQAPDLILLGQGVGRGASGGAEPSAAGAAGGAGERLRVGHGLQRRLGASRVVEVSHDEQTLLGMALGAATAGLLPVVELRSLAAARAALTQLGAEAARLQYASGGRHRNPLVLRVPGFGVDDAGADGPGDHFLAALREIPGVVIACPAHPSDAPAVLRTCLASARVDGTVCIVVEPTPLYHQQDMLADGDRAWLAPYPPTGWWGMGHVPIGRATTWGSGEDLTLATFGTGLRTCLHAVDVLAARGVTARVVDLRWLAPLPVDDVLTQARATGSCVIVDETPSATGVAEALVTAMLEAGFVGRLARVSAEPCFPPLERLDDTVAPSVAAVVDTALAVLDPR